MEVVVKYGTLIHTHTKFEEINRYSTTEEKVMLYCRCASQRVHNKRIVGVEV